MADETLYTNQVPTLTNVSEGQNTTLGTTITFADNKPVVGVQFWAPDTPLGTYQGAVWEATADDSPAETGTGTLIATTDSVAAGTLTPSSYNILPLTSVTSFVPDPAKTYVFGLRTSSGRYAATGGYWSGFSLTNNGITGVADGTITPLGTMANGRFIDGSITAYPPKTFNSNGYYIGPVRRAASSAVPGAGTNTAAATIKSLAVKVVRAAARCVAAASATSVARKVSPAGVTSPAAAIARSAAKHVTPAAVRAAAAVSVVSAAAKKTPGVGVTTGVAVAVASGSARPVTARCIAGAVIRSTASRATPSFAVTTAVAATGAVTRHQTSVSARSSAASYSRSASTKRLPATGRAVTAPTASGFADQVGATRSVSGRCSAVVLAYGRGRRLVTRPAHGTIIRPFTGVIYRP